MREIFPGLRALWLLLLIAVPGNAAANQTARVLTLCLDVDETPETRIATLVKDGWQSGGDELTALGVALTLTRINAGNPSQWNDDRDIAREAAKKALSVSVDTQLLVAPDQSAVVFIGRDSWRLQTCLYLGRSLDLAPVDAALDGSFVRQIGEVFRIRGDGVKSLISAHGITEAGRAMFDPPLAYAMSFAVRLDRQAGDS